MALLSYAELKPQVVKTKKKVDTFTTSIADLKKKVARRGAAKASSNGLSTRKSHLEQRLGELNRTPRFHDPSFKREKDELALTIESLQQTMERAAADIRAADRAKGLLDEQEPSLKGVKQRLSLLVKVQKTVEDLGLAKFNGTLGVVVDQRLADLDMKPEPPWVVEAVTSYAKERAAEARKTQKEVADNRKQLEKDSKDLAGLQGSEAAISKRIEALERRLEREKERVLAERKFIYTKLNNKRSVHPGLTQRERNFWYEHSNVRDLGNKDWATKGVEFSAKLRTSARKIEELKADIKELKAGPEKIRVLKSSIRKLEKDIATADKANAAAGGWPKGKAPRIGYIANAHAFEKYMAEWMRWLGWDNAKAMPVGPDEGIDVKATGALGQAKHWDTEVGIEEVQRHNGVCEGIQKYGRVFLSKSGYTPQAIKWANDRDLPLFEMKAGSKDAGVVASTKAGEKLLKVGAKAMKGNKRN